MQIGTVLVFASADCDSRIDWIRQALGPSVVVIVSTDELMGVNEMIAECTVIIVDSEMEWLLFEGACPRRLIVVNTDSPLTMVASCLPEYVNLPFDLTSPKRKERSMRSFRRFVESGA